MSTTPAIAACAARLITCSGVARWRRTVFWSRSTCGISSGSQSDRALHAGIITLPSGCAPTEQFSLIERALQFLDSETNQGRDAVNRWIEITRDGSLLVHDLPRQGRRS